MASHFIHINLKKNHDRLLTKTLETNITCDDRTKSISSIMTNPKKQFSKISYILKDIKSYSYNQLIKKYNILPFQYILIQMDNFIKGKYCHSLASFKEKLLFEYKEEFLKKVYKIKEINKKIPLFYDFYKSYLDFFCSPVFADLQLNELIGKTVEKKAKAFYNENYKEEPQKKTKTMNVIIFTSKIRRDLSKRTNLTNLSKTTIMEGNLTNKSSIVSATSIAKIFNEIDSSHKINIKNNNNNTFIENKSFTIKNENNKNDKKNNIVNKNKNLISIQIKRNTNLKEKIHLNKKITYLTIENSNIINSFHLNNNNNLNNFNTDINLKNKKLSIKKKKPQVIKIKNENNKVNSIISLESSVRLYNNSHREHKKSSYNFNSNNNGYILSNKSGNNTTSHILNYTKKRIQKPNSRNYVCGFFENKNTFSHLNGNIINRMNSLGNNASNNCAQSLNNLNTQSIIKPKAKKILKLPKSDNKKIINNNDNSKSIIKIENKYNNNNLNDNNNTQKLKIDNILINSNENKNNLTIKQYKKISPYKKPECGSINILKTKNNINKILSYKNCNNAKSKNKISNITIKWNKKEKQIENQKQKFTFQNKNIYQKKK